MTKSGASGSTAMTCTSMTTPAAQLTADDIVNKDVYDRLRLWRKERSDAEGIPAYCIMHTKTLVEIANTLPSTPRELAAIKGFGKNKTQKYGVEVLEIVGRRRK